jgi:mannan endo-1,4-beta-mannosidase
MENATKFGGWACVVACVLGIGASACSADEPEKKKEKARSAVSDPREPVNPNASAKTRDVLRLLYELPDRPDKRVISGQVMHVFVGGGYEFASSGGGLNPNVYSRLDDIHDQSGVWVGIAGAEYTDWFPGNGIMGWALNPRLIEHSRKGGIVELHFHPRNPVDPRVGIPGDWNGWWGPSGGGAQVTADVLLNPGPVHDRWMQLLDDAAAGLRELRDNDVTVLWRPMHARDGDPWWWSYLNLPQDDYNRIWAHMVDYFSNTWGLDNILYMQSWYYVSSTAYSSYAGDSNVDIVAVDHGEDPAADYDTEYAYLLALGKPFGISQGSIGDAVGNGDYDMRRELDLIKNRWPRCTFLVQFDYDHDYAWADSLRLDMPGNRFVSEMLADRWIVNAGEIFSSSQPPSCPNGTLCDGTTVTGSLDQTICGSDLMTLQCTSSGWQQTGESCSCGGATACPGGTRCDGSNVDGNLGDEVCGTDFINWLCTENGWQTTDNPCSC